MIVNHCGRQLTWMMLDSVMKCRRYSFYVIDISQRCLFFSNFGQDCVPANVFSEKYPFWYIGVLSFIYVLCISSCSQYRRTFGKLLCLFGGVAWETNARTIRHHREFSVKYSEELRIGEGKRYIRTEKSNTWRKPPKMSLSFRTKKPHPDC